MVPDTEQDVDGAWIFYSKPGSQRWSGMAAFKAQDTVFWHHDYHPGRGRYAERLAAGDTVELLVDRRFLASGVLLAGDELKFIDPVGHICRPVRILEVYKPPLGRSDLESYIDRELLEQFPSPVFPVTEPVLEWFNMERSGRDYPPLPYPREALEEALARRSLAEDANVFAEKSGVRPDAATAEAIGWTGRPFRESDLPPRGSPGPEQEKTPASDDDDDGETGEGEAASGDVDVQIPYVLDAPADSEDQLERGPFALFLARRLHLIWCQINGHAPGADGEPTRPSPPDSDTFIAHVDSPWGGGKTTFANFVARVLDPRGETLSERHFLRSSVAATRPIAELASVRLDDVFVPPFALDAPRKWPGARRPWIIARYNAWRDQFVQPPWWQIFLNLYDAIGREVRRDAAVDLRAGRPWSAVKGWARWGGIQLSRFGYQVWNSKLKTQLGLWLFAAALLLILWRTGVVDSVLGSSTATTPGAPPAIEARKVSEWIALAVAILGLGGASIATLFTVLSQSLSPDLDFTSEHKHIGVRDPIHRFRRAFNRILRATERPVLLIVDDLDRCEPRTVVEVMRGFQTIIRSPRLFVLLLGDRAWIEGAHDVHHKDLVELQGSEGKLGSLYVRKVIQLSFRLPIMKDESRRQFARSVLGEPLEAVKAAVTPVLQKVEQNARTIATGKASIGEKEAALRDVRAEAKKALPPGLDEEDRAAAAAAIDEIATTQSVAAAGADTAQQREVFNAVTRLIDCLPNNPRQIKRIFMAFATYEQVGRHLFGYQLTPAGKDGERLARRWRQLALWVTLAVEWPETWRAVAKRPELLDVAYAPARSRAAREKALLKPVDEIDRPAVLAVLRRLRTDPALVTLLSGKAQAGLSPESQAFAQTAMEPEAVYEFNRIIWEPGFLLQKEARA